MSHVPFHSSTFSLLGVEWKSLAVQDVVHHTQDEAGVRGRVDALDLKKVVCSGQRLMGHHGAQNCLNSGGVAEERLFSFRFSKFVYTSTLKNYKVFGGLLKGLQKV